MMMRSHLDGIAVPAVHAPLTARELAKAVLREFNCHGVDEFVDSCDDDEILETVLVMVRASRTDV